MPMRQDAKEETNIHRRSDPDSSGGPEMAARVKQSSATFARATHAYEAGELEVTACDRL